MKLDAFKNILIVDDEQGEIDDLAYIFENDMDCEVLTYLYEQDELYHKKHENIRIVFFDLNITATAIDTNSMEDINWRTNSSLRKVFNDLAQAIIDVIHSQNTPYALIFWTKHIEVVDEFKKYILERKVAIPNPVHVSGLDKVKFKNEIDKKSMVESVIKDTIFYNLINFEKMLQDEVKNIMFNILDIANEDNMSIWDKNNYHVNLQLFLRTIASTHVGFENAKANPSKSLTEALIPVITDKFIKIANKNRIWDDLLNFGDINKKDCHFARNNNVPKLNSLFHIDENPKSLNTRGAVFGINDPKVFFKNKFNIKKESTILEETLSGFPKQSRSEVEFILIEISTACDFSQDKRRFNKYIVGLKIKRECYDLYIDNLKTQSKTLRQSVLDIRSSFFDEITGENFNILLNNNFVLTLNHIEENDSTLKHLFTFKKEMMDYIGNTYANHISRIGISAF